MGLIDTLNAGFQSINRRLWILLLPIALDLVLWAGPRISAESLVLQGYDLAAEAVAASIRTGETTPAVPVDVSDLDRQLLDIRTALPQASGAGNLAVYLAGPVPPVLAGPAERLLTSPLPLTVAAMPMPSFMKLTNQESLGVAPVLPIGQPLAVFGLYLLLSALGLPIVALYLAMVAKAVRDPAAITPSLRDYLRALGVVALWMLLAGGFVAGIVLPGFAIGSLIAAVVPALGLIVVSVVLAFPLWLRLGLFFWDAAVLADDRPIWGGMLAALRMMRGQFWRSAGFVAVSYFILYGITAGLQRLAPLHPALVVIAIVVNAYVATGLVAASMVFFKERALAMQTVAVRGAA